MNKVSPSLLAVLLAGLGMLGPFSIDTYLPSFPSIARDLQIDSLQVQQTLSAYLIPFACMTLLHGTLSDALGRRPVILVSLLVFVLASFGCAVAPSYGTLLVFRMLQGVSAGAGMVVGRAIIRDSLEGAAAQRLMSLVTMIFGLAPAIAPMIGGWLERYLGWHAVFYFLAAYSGLLLVATYYGLAETLPASKRQPFALPTLVRDYARLGTDRRLLLLSATIAFNFAGFFIYVVSAPGFVYSVLRLESTEFAYLFVPGISGVMAGAFLSGRVAGRLSPRRTVAIGYIVMMTAALGNLVYTWLFTASLPFAVAPLFLYAAGMSVAMPSVTLLALDLFPHHRGMTASLQSFQQSLLSGITAGAVAPWTSHSAWAMACAMAIALAIGAVAWRSYTRIIPEAAHA